ncbi:hypothetical protein GCM10027258_32040 [Amycolatopsis stemonae]
MFPGFPARVTFNPTQLGIHGGGSTVDHTGPGPGTTTGHSPSHAELVEFVGAPATRSWCASAGARIRAAGRGRGITRLPGRGQRRFRAVQLVAAHAEQEMVQKNRARVDALPFGFASG